MSKNYIKIRGNNGKEFKISFVPLKVTGKINPVLRGYLSLWIGDNLHKFQATYRIYRYKYDELEERYVAKIDINSFEMLHSFPVVFFRAYIIDGKIENATYSIDYIESDQSCTVTNGNADDVGENFYGSEITDYHFDNQYLDYKKAVEILK